MKRSAFTLIEMMVVIAIIGILTSLLLVALGPVRQLARQTECTNNMRNLGHAVQLFGAAKARYPGSFEWSPNIDAGGNGLEPWPWPVVLLPYLGEESKYKTFFGPPSSIMSARYMRVFACPADPEILGESPDLSYTANCGLDDSSLPQQHDDKGNGLFHSRLTAQASSLWDAMELPQTPQSLVTIPFMRIPDGASHTLLFSENLAATRWNDNGPPAAGYHPEYGIGVVWVPGQASNGGPQNAFYDANASGPSIYAPSMMNARASSSHGDKFNLVTADGATRSIQAGIDWDIWRKLLTPDGARAAMTTGDPSAGGELNINDFQ